MKPSENIPTPRPSCGANIVAMKVWGRLFQTLAFLLILRLVSFAETPPASAPAGKIAPTPKQLEQSSRALKQKGPSAAYTRLSDFALAKNSGVLGLRASLALGYFDYNKGNYAQAAKWLERAKGDSLLRQYALYWDAETKRALGRNVEALAELQQFRKDFPDSVLADLVLQSLAETALVLNHPADALTALNSYVTTTEKPALLFLRAEALEQSGEQLQAGADYQTVFLRFATSPQAGESGMKLEFLHSRLGDKVPAVPADQRFARAALLYAAKFWSESRSEYAQILPQLSGADRERAELRILECGVALGAGPSALAALKITDPDVDAERLSSLAQYYRSVPQEIEMVAAVEAAATRAPTSQWTEAALFIAGNYYWTLLDRDSAAGFYKRVAENFPSAADATPAQWRVAWVAVLKRQPEAAEFLADHLRRFPGSQFTPDALYWLGRLAEETGNGALARSYYGKLLERYPVNYFEALGTARLTALGDGPKAEADVLDLVPPLPPPPAIGATIPPAAANRKARADALRSIAFDTSAEAELRAAYDATGEPRFLLEAAQTALNAGHCGAAIVTIRQIYPKLVSHPIPDLPREVWLTAYPLPFDASIRQWSGRAGIDPHLVAGLIRQESAFEPEARSGSNALGLMQLLPKTARSLAKQAKVRYSQAQLFDPDYNLRLGTIYLASLRKDFGGVEMALAAYNAGEDRVASWTAGQNYREPAEFVDSIPFSETRDYVEIVTRNADFYRQLYGVHQDESRQARPRRSRQHQALR